MLLKNLLYNPAVLPLLHHTRKPPHEHFDNNVEPCFYGISPDQQCPKVVTMAGRKMICD